MVPEDTTKKKEWTMGASTQPPVETLLLNVRAARQMTDAAEERLKKSQEVLAEHESALRGAIEAGGTTGDPMLDLTMRCHRYDLELAAAFRELDTELKGKIGELALVVFETKIMTTHRQIGECDFENRTMFRIAVLAGDTLAWNEKGLGGYVTVPTERYATGEVAKIFGDRAPRPAVSDGDLFARAYIDDPKPLDLLVREDRWRTHLFIGDNAVRRYLSAKCMLPIFGAAAQALGRLVLQPTDEDCS